MATQYYVLVVVLLLTLVHSSLSDVRVNLDENSGMNDVCGDVITLFPGNTSIVTATGRVKNGACGVMYRAISTYKGEEFKEICVTLKTDRLQTCDVKIIISAFVFSGFTSDEVKIFDCRKNEGITRQWCSPADQLRVEVMESLDYRLRMTNNKYSFRAEISAHFTEIRGVDIDAYLHDRYNKDAKDREYQNKVEGIVVAVCLAAIFLVLMIVMWCYYKHKAVNAPHQEVAYVDFTGVQVTKQPIMKTIRSKLRLKPHRRRLSSVGVEPPSREVRYDNRSDGSPRMGSPSDDPHDSDPASGSAVTMEIEQKTKFLESDQI